MVEGRDRTFTEGLISDLENLNKFAAASMDGDKKAMLDSFNRFSWDDSKVKDHLPRFCELEQRDLKLIDSVFSHLCPKYSLVHSPTFNAMSLWFKARLHLQHQLSPLNFRD